MAGRAFKSLARGIHHATPQVEAESSLRAARKLAVDNKLAVEDILKEAGVTPASCPPPPHPEPSRPAPSRPASSRPKKGYQVMAFDRGEFYHKTAVARATRDLGPGFTTRNDRVNNQWLFYRAGYTAGPNDMYMRVVKPEKGLTVHTLK